MLLVWLDRIGGVPTLFAAWYFMGTKYWFLLFLIDFYKENDFLLARFSSERLKTLLFWLSMVYILEDFSDKIFMVEFSLLVLINW